MQRNTCQMYYQENGIAAILHLPVGKPLIRARRHYNGYIGFSFADIPVKRFMSFLQELRIRRIFKDKWKCQ